MRSWNSAINKEMRRSLSSRSIWRNSFGSWRVNQVNWQRQQKFVSGLLPSLNRKLHGKEYSSLTHAVEAAQIEEWHLGEAERSTHGEDHEQHGKQRELPWTKELPRKDLGQADQKVPGKLKVNPANKPVKVSRSL